MLWSDGRDDGDLTSYSYSSDDGQHLSFFEKLALTPFTLILDIVTSPIQSFFADDGNLEWSSSSDHHHHESKRRDSDGPSRPTPRSSGSSRPGPPNQSPTLRKRSAFVSTLTELKLIAAAATIGDSRMPRNG